MMSVVTKEVGMRNDGNNKMVAHIKCWCVLRQRTMVLHASTHRTEPKNAHWQNELQKLWFVGGCRHSDQLRRGAR